jgi:GMP/IMP 5'-nucleotidase
MSRPTLVSFDLDGTLTDSSFVDSVWLVGIPQVYALQKGISLESAKLEVKEQYDEVGRERLEWYSLQHWIDKFELDVSPGELLNRYRDRIRAFPETPQILKEIKRRGLRQIVVSNARREFVDLELEKTGLGPFFERVFSSTSDFGLIKKTVDVFRRVCEICDVSPGEMVHVGDDQVFDFQVPRELGASAFFLDRTGRCTGDSVVHDLNDFRERLLRSR